MSWPDHACNAYCSADAHCDVLRIWTDGAVPVHEATPRDIAASIERRNGIRIVRCEPAPEAPPIKPGEPPIGRVTGQPMRHERTWLVWWKDWTPC